MVGTCAALSVSQLQKTVAKPTAVEQDGRRVDDKNMAYTHETEEQINIVLSGQVRFRVGDEETVLERAAFYLMPRHVEHELWNDTGEFAQIIEIYTPPGMEQNSPRQAPRPSQAATASLTLTITPPAAQADHRLVDSEHIAEKGGGRAARSSICMTTRRSEKMCKSRVVVGVPVARC